MKRSFTKWALVTLLPLSALVVGCGGDDDDNGGAGGSTAGTSSGGTSAGGTGGAAGSTAGTSNGGTAGSTAGTSNGGTAGTTGGSAGTTGGSAGTAPSGGPTTCQATNGYNGCCSADGKTAYYFDGGVQTEECEDDQVCTWSADGGFYACGAGPATTDPDKVFPSACGGTLTDEVTGCEPACSKDADCASNENGTMCDTTAGVCVECKADTDCKDGVCDGGACVECKDDTTCTTSENGKVCTSFGICGCAKATDCAGSPAGAACIELGLGDLALCGCNADADCANSTAGKDCLDSGSCGVKCKTNTDCKDTTKPICDVDSGNCGECGTNADCASSTKGKVCNTSSNVCTECLADADCANSAKGKFCDTDKNACVACGSDFDCTDPTKPACNAGTCGANSQCTGADLTEDADDGPLGATDITPKTGDTSSTTGHSICGSPATESDYFKFTTNDGDSVTLSLSWTDTKQDLDLFVFNDKGEPLALDFYKSPAVVQVSYLPKGTYYVSITRYDEEPVAAVTPYTLAFSRTAGKCASITDCAKGSINAYSFRGSCNATTGACEAIDGKGAVAKGGACDSSDDCTSKVCAETVFNESAAKFAVCTVTCTKDTDCGADQYCTTFYQSNNLCSPKCTKDSECPSYGPNQPPTGTATWAYLTCDAASGKCSIPADN